MVSGVAACAVCVKEPIAMADMTIALHTPALAIDLMVVDILMLSVCPSAFRMMYK
ncbi:hypothetical protein D3C78_1759080 [compost metagenome]